MATIYLLQRTQIIPGTPGGGLELFFHARQPTAYYTCRYAFYSYLTALYRAGISGPGNYVYGGAPVVNAVGVDDRTCLAMAPGH